MTRPPTAAASSCAGLPAGTTPATEPTAHADKARPTIGSPSPASRRFDRREVLRSTGDAISPARGLRVGSQDRRSCEQQRDRKGERDFAHQLSPWFVGMCPTWQCRDRPFYRPGLFGPRLNIGDSASLSSISAAALSLRMSRESLTTYLQFDLGAKSSDAKSGSS